MPFHNRLQLGDEQAEATHPSKSHSLVSAEEKGAARFATVGKKYMVKLPGKKEHGKKRQVLENISNKKSMDAADTGARDNAKRLRKAEAVPKEALRKAEAVPKEAKVAAAVPKEAKVAAAAVPKAAAESKSFFRFSKSDQGGEDEAAAAAAAECDVRRRFRKTKTRPLSIPIPKALSASLQLQEHSFDDVDSLSTDMDNLMTEPPGNAYGDGNDEFSNPVYSRCILEYLQSEEQQFTINPSFLCNDPAEVNPHMRSILIDWLIEVQNHLLLEQSTLHLAVRLLDQFVLRHTVALSQFQLVGITCIFIAAKLEERFAPPIEKLVRLTDNTYSGKEMLHMELVVLRKMDFKMHIPIPTEYLEPYLRSMPSLPVFENNTVRLRDLCLYLLDLTLHDIHMVQWTASTVAASTLCVAMKIVAEHCGDEDFSGDDGDEEQEQPMQTSCSLKYDCPTTLWTATLQRNTGYSEQQLLACMQRIAKLLKRADKSKYQAARRKYESNAYFGSISCWDGLYTPVVNEIITTEIINNVMM